MAHSVAVNDMVARVRSQADLETSDQANDVVTDAQIIIWLDRANREVRELAHATTLTELPTTRATLTLPTAALPSDCLRVLAVDVLDGSTYLPLTKWNWHDRGRFEGMDRPAWRVDGPNIMFLPEQPTTGTYRVWYVPVPTTLAGGASVDMVNGWDDYCVAAAVLECRDKQDLPTERHERKLERIAQRIKREAARMGEGGTTTVADVRTGPDSDYYNS